MTPKVMATMRVRHTAILYALGVAKSPDRLQVGLIDRQGKTRSVTLPGGQARIVELRILGGLSEQEVAETVAVSRSTVTREWRSARAWLFHPHDTRACRAPQ